MRQSSTNDSCRLPARGQGLLTLFARLVFVGVVSILPSCASWDGHFNVLGYSTRPNYDTCIRTVRVPIAESKTFYSVLPAPGLEKDLTRAIVREIESKTPYKVVQENADTELICTIKSFRKLPLLFSQLNYVREAETTMEVEVIWRDLRSGEILSQRARRRGQPRPEDPGLTQGILDPLVQAQQAPPGSRPIIPGTPGGPDGIVPSPDNPLRPEELAINDRDPERAPPPLTLRSIAHFRPELGESITTAMQRNVDRMATHIVSMMEQPW